MTHTLYIVISCSNSFSVWDRIWNQSSAFLAVREDWKHFQSCFFYLWENCFLFLWVWLTKLFFGPLAKNSLRSKAEDFFSARFTNLMRNSLLSSRQQELIVENNRWVSFKLLECVEIYQSISCWMTTFFFIIRKSQLAYDIKYQYDITIKMISQISFLKDLKTRKYSSAVNL